MATVLSHRFAVLAAVAFLLAGDLGVAAPVAAKDPHVFLDDSGTVRQTTSQATPTLPPGFSDSTVFSGLNQPTKVAFGPDGKVWVLQKNGQVLYYPNISSSSPVLFANLSNEVNSYWDRGLHGLAISPDYATDHTIYVQYAWDHNPVSDLSGNPYNAPVSWNDSCPANPGGLTDGCAIMGRISALIATSNGLAWSGTEQVLVTGWCQQFPSHSNDDLQIGPGGYLYSSAGDGASFSGGDYGQQGGSAGTVVTPANPCGDPPHAAGTADTAPAAEGGGLRSQSVRRTDGPAVLNGAILRIDPATGNGVASNPFYSGNGNNNASRILAYGLRNPYRFAFRPGHDEIWVGDVGYNNWEEINRLLLPATSANDNFGWPCVEGNQANTYFGGTALALCTSLSGSIAPYYTYNHNAYLYSGDSTNTTCGPGSSSISGDAFYAGTRYPPAYRGALFFGDHSRNCIWAMLPGSNGLPDSTKITTIVSASAGAVDVESGPGGDIFYVDYDNGSIHRLSYDAPQAVVSSDVTSSDAPLTVHFNGSGSSGGGGALTYAWDVPGGSCDSTASVAPTCIFNNPGVFGVRLTVTDANGATTTSAAYNITVGSAIAPTVGIDTIDGAAPPATPPLDGSGFPPSVRPSGDPAIWAVGDSITFSGHATDSDGHAIPATDLSWQWDMLHCPSNCHAHSLQTFAHTAGDAFVAPDHDYPSLLRLTLTATDSHGLSSSQSVYLYPKTAVLTLHSSPSGLALTAGTVVNATTPFSATFLVGGGVQLGAATTQTLGASQYTFTSWSGGGAANHAITMPASALTLTANYVQKLASTYLSDLTPTSAVNGWGPYERDMSNGEQAAGDGHPITVGDVVYAKGLGTHALSDLRYAINGTCNTFSAIVGVDAEAPNGDVDFQVWLDEVQAYDSGTLSGAASKTVSVALSGKQELRLVVVVVNSGNGDHADWANAKVTCGVSPDNTPPTVTAPAYRLRASRALGATTTSVHIAWSASDPSGVAAYVLQRQQNGGAWHDVALVAATATSLNQTLTLGASYRYRVRATDGVGNVSAWIYGRTLKAVLVQQSNSKITYQGSWTSTTLSAASGGSLKYAKMAAASASYAFVGSAIAWVAYTGPTRGQARVYLDGVLKTTLDLHAATNTAKPIVYAFNWGVNGSHTIKIVVVGTAGRPRVDVDALVSLVLS